MTALLGGALYLALGIVAVDGASAQSCIEGPISTSTVTPGSFDFNFQVCSLFSAAARVWVDQPSFGQPGGFRRASARRQCGAQGTFNVRLTSNRFNTATGTLTVRVTSNTPVNCLSSPVVHTVSGTTHIISAQCTITVGSCGP